MTIFWNVPGSTSEAQLFLVYHSVTCWSTKRYHNPVKENIISFDLRYGSMIYSKRLLLTAPSHGALNRPSIKCAIRGSAYAQQNDIVLFCKIILQALSSAMSQNCICILHHEIMVLGPHITKPFVGGCVLVHNFCVFVIWI